MNYHEMSLGKLNYNDVAVWDLEYTNCHEKTNVLSWAIIINEQRHNFVNFMWLLKIFIMMYIHVVFSTE